MLAITNNPGDFIPAVLFIIYIGWVMFKARTHTPCTQCGKWMRINPDPALTMCWACEKEGYTKKVWTYPECGHSDWLQCNEKCYREEYTTTMDMSTIVYTMLMGVQQAVHAELHNAWEYMPESYWYDWKYRVYHATAIMYYPEHGLTIEEECTHSGSMSYTYLHTSEDGDVTRCRCLTCGHTTVEVW